MDNAASSTRQKALALNLDAKTYCRFQLATFAL
jgi:hypothetical protein